MTRVEPPASARPVGRDDVRDIVRRELFLEIFRRKFFSCLGYLLMITVILGIPSFIVASFAAKTGFVEIPVLTAWLYEPAAPLRTVASSGTSAEVIMLNVASRSKYEPSSGLLNATIKENELTALAVASMRNANAADLPFEMSGVQIAVDPDLVEVFAVAPRGSREATVLIRFIPRVVGRSVELELKELRLGAAKVPHRLAQSLASVISRFVSDSISKEFGSVGAITAVKAESGTLRVTLIPKDR
jgi:hypothetical protein